MCGSAWDGVSPDTSRWCRTAGRQHCTSGNRWSGNLQAAVDVVGGGSNVAGVLAEQEAQALIEKARAEAEQKAREMVAEVKADEESARILSEAEEKNKQFEALAMSNLDRAVNYVLERVIGKA